MSGDGDARTLSLRWYARRRSRARAGPFAADADIDAHYPELEVLYQDLLVTDLFSEVGPGQAGDASEIARIRGDVWRRTHGDRGAIEERRRTNVMLRTELDACRWREDRAAFASTVMARTPPAPASR